MMLPLCSLTFSLLWSLLFFSSGLALQCNKTQYEWPIDKPTLCCQKCPPGFYLSRYSRSQTTCEIKCEPCQPGRYLDTYNLEMSCNVCDDCEKAHFETVSNCKETHNTVCKCRDGYRCRDGSCTKCVPIPKTIKPTPPPPTTVKSRFTSATRTTVKPSNSIRDTQWFLVIIALLCAGIALVVVTKIKPLLNLIRTNYGYIFGKTPVTIHRCAVDDDVSKPVQEVCGKCDHCIDLCIKE